MFASLCAACNLLCLTCRQNSSASMMSVDLHLVCVTEFQLHGSLSFIQGKETPVKIIYGVLQLQLAHVRLLQSPRLLSEPWQNGPANPLPLLSPPLAASIPQTFHHNSRSFFLSIYRLPGLGTM
ncbi:hypothetical protein E2C01_064856 [Portunus trituberculatus]|uniref:Secreted protein n=1 Tax=Portunus trituberculatus TaxID=210409 RepID=A0A5B7HHB0_PORTR|nr:hypothetical protein [Portunus trituberculatus]